MQEVCLRLGLTALSRAFLLGCGVFAALPILAEPAAPVAVSQVGQKERSITEWLRRMHEASRRRAYVGTLVVSAGVNMASSRVWHVCDGTRQIERVESLTGEPRSTFRRNTEVVTFSPQTRVAVSEQRESFGLFPHLLSAPDSSIEQFYKASAKGRERVAGLDADIVLLEPRDAMRFGYRIWSEQRTGLVIKMQTLDAQGGVLEQMAFSELQLDAPVSMEKLNRMMSNTEGYKVESPELVRTTATAEGWALRHPVAGFKSMSCYRRPDANGAGVLQWVFSDGLATVSLFIESDRQGRHAQEGLLVMGATHTLLRRWTGAQGSWRLTLVGEVPAQTLQAFAQGLGRVP